MVCSWKLCFKELIFGCNISCISHILIFKFLDVTGRELMEIGLELTVHVGGPGSGSSEPESKSTVMSAT